MITGIAFILAIVLLIAVAFVSYRKGRGDGWDAREVYYERLRQIPVAGSIVVMPAMGEVMILGRGKNDEDTECIDYILTSFLAGRFPTELSDEELDNHTISSPLDEFIAQAEPALRL